jgi:ADP-ribose pyrophosphatase YjhB (NUDIX family)
MELEHDIQRKIILRLIHNPKLSFNELWSKEGESNKFAYHVNKLEELKLIQKNGDGYYTLTEEGKKLSAFIEGDTGTRAEFPTFSIVILAHNGDKYVCQKRLKEPFYGYWSFISGKINFGQNLFECATRDLLEETGLHATEWKLKAIEQVKTYEDEKLLFHHYLFHIETGKVTGELKTQTHKAENAWLTLEEYKKRETLPSEKFFDHIFPAKRTIMLEVERQMKNGKFVGMKVINVTNL